MPITSTGAIYYFKDDLGNPLVGGKVYTYEYNTSQPKDTYKTGARITPHTNPVILNDSGSVEWYLKDDYTLRVYDANDVFLEEQHIVAPSKAVLDVVSDKLDTLIADLKEAAYRDTGTAAAQVPLNSDLGSVAYSDIGTNPDQVPLNSNLGAAANPSITEDRNGFLRNGNKHAATTDAAGNLSVTSIQAGVTAPKLAVKEFTFTGDRVLHGLSPDRIVAVNISYIVNNVAYFAYEGVRVDSSYLVYVYNVGSKKTAIVTYRFES